MKNTNYSGSTAATGKKRILSGDARRQVIYMVGGVALGFLLPYATVYGGSAPFGIGLAASVTGPGAILIGLATMAGYLVRGMTDALRYIAALVTVAGIRWSVGGFKRVTRSRIFPSVTAFLGTVITGSALMPGDTPSPLAVFTVLSEGLLAGGFAFFASTVCREWVGDERQALSQEAEVCLIVLMAVAMMALFTIEFGGIAPARILA